MTRFPLSAPAFDGRSRTVDAGAVFEWLRLGWHIFTAHPGLWLTGALLICVGYLGMMAVWLVGPLLAALLAPVLAAGVLTLCGNAARGEPLALAQLLTGFHVRVTPLLSLGCGVAAALLAIRLLLWLAWGSAMAGGALTGLGALLGGSLFALLLSLLLFLPLGMVLWFAPALVFFNDMPPRAACRASFDACLRNLPPFLLLGLVVCVLAFFAALPAGLGFLVLLPVLAGTAYASYRDIFLAH